MFDLIPAATDVTDAMINVRGPKIGLRKLRRLSSVHTLGWDPERE